MNKDLNAGTEADRDMQPIVTTSGQPCTKPLVMRCYYDDNLCGGKIMQVGSFKKYLCEKCKKEDDSVCDEPLDTGYHAMDTRNEWD